MSDTRQVRVLHVIESYGAGSASAMHDYVVATPELSHHLVRRLRNDDDHADDGELGVFDSTSEMADGTLAAIRSVRARITELKPDVVHAHSSFGGAFARLATRRGRGPLIVYTPHCFATERADLGRLARAAYGLAERTLGRNTDVVAGCSRREVELARRFAPKARHVWVPNVTSRWLSRERSERVETTEGIHGYSTDGEPYIVAMGRLAPQRDPQFFADLVTQLREQGRAERAVWIGGGDPAEVARLEAKGIEVTGWLPRSEGLQRMGRAALYVHTARWDGAPMTLVEADALGLPIVARTSPALTACPATYLAETATGLAGVAARVLQDPVESNANRAAWTDYFADHTVKHQHDALLEAYAPW